MYLFADCIEITTNSAAAVDIRKISAGEIIDKVVLRIKTAAVRAAGAATITIGDDDDADSYTLASDVKASAGTVYGLDPVERGAYLYDATKKGSFLKAYAAEGKTIKAVLSAAVDTEAVVQIMVWGYKANLT